MSVITYIVIILIMVNMFRMAAYIILSNVEIILSSHKARHAKKHRTFKSEYLPTVTVLVPAHNEEACIYATLTSICSSIYPKSKLRVIVVNDGSVDDTKHIVRQFIKDDKTGTSLRLINQKNKGKAAALNYALKRYVNSTLVMTIDADSQLDKRAIRNSAAHFRSQSVIGASSNVNIIENGTVLGLAQRFEYAIGYQMKRAESLANVEYIIGGVGSMFRTKALKEVNYYDTNTQTEDIDLTLKLLAHFGNTKYKLIHAPDALTYTAPVLDTNALIKQRLRWKYGRWQTFLKHRSLFYNTNAKYSKVLTFGVMPYALLQEFLMLVEPLAVGVTFYFAALYGDITTFLFAVIVATCYILINIWASDNMTIGARLRLSYYAIPMYLLLYVISYVEYMAIVFGLVKIPKLRSSIKKKHITWTSPERAVGVA